VSARYERRFAGPANAGLRKLIRESVSAYMCAPSRRRAILSIASTVALTASGRATLEAVADDYCVDTGDFQPRCSCDACCAGNLQRLGAL
jgi:hypothetical protein